MKRSELILIVALNAACGEQRSDEGLVVRSPARLRQALTSMDQALCERLDVALTFDRSDDLAPPALDRAPLIPKPNQTCTWFLENEAELSSGTYDLIVDFTTRAPPGSCSAPLLVGAYVKRAVVFPFEEGFSGLTDADFFSRVGEETALSERAVTFDPDADQRDNLAEVAQGSDPCKQSSLPVVELTVGTSTFSEGTPITFTLRTEDADDVRHRVTLSIRQPHGPSFGTETIRFAAFTGDPEGALVTPSAERPPSEKWILTATQDDEPRAGAARWTVELIPDEPFVGLLAVVAGADDGQGNVLFAGEPIMLAVEDRDDPTLLLFDQGGTEVPLDTLRFAEEGNAPTVHRFRFQDDDLDADVSTWTAELSSGPAGMTLMRDGAYWNLGWSPTNATAVAAAPGSLEAVIGFLDGAAPRGQSRLSLEISPLFNDPPSFTAPVIGEQALPSVPFTQHEMFFEVIDPDQVEAAPACEIAVLPLAPTSCAPFTGMRCEPVGPRDGERWSYSIVLEPAADYFTACGSAPTFELSYSIRDVPPLDASNGPAVLMTQSSCVNQPAPCVEHLILRTANVAAGAAVTGGPAFIPGYANVSPALIDGTLQRALVSVEDPADSFNDYVVAIDLTFPNPTMVHRFAKSDVCGVVDARPRELGAVDEVNGRMLVYGRMLSGSYCTGASGAFLVDSITNAATFISSQTLCGTQTNDTMQNPLVDRLGNFYVPCRTDPGQIARIQPDGTIDTVTVSDYVYSGSNDGGQNALVRDPGAGVDWLVWLDNTGFLLVDLGSAFGTGSVMTQKITMGATWTADRVEDHAVDAERIGYVFAYHVRNVGAELYRIAFSGGAVREGPLALGDIGGSFSNGNSYMRLVLRDGSAPGPAGDPDLVVSPGSSGDPRPVIDLDAFAIVAMRPASDFYLGFSPGIFESPDRRFFMAPTISAYEDPAITGIYLYPWDMSQPRQLLEMPVPSGGADDAAHTVVSHSGNLAVVSEDDQVSVVYFVDAAAGLD